MDGWTDRRTRFTQIFHVDIDALGRDTVLYADEKIAFVIGDPCPDELHRAEALAFETFAEHELIARGGCSELVIEDQRPRGVGARIVDSLFIGAELNALITRRRKSVRQFRPLRDIQEVDRLFIGAAGSNSVNQQRAILGKVIQLHRRILVGAQFRGIDQPLVLTVQSTPQIDRSLVFVRKAFLEKIIPAALDRNTVALDAFEFREFIDDFVANLHLRKVLFGVFHLFVDPGAGGRTFCVLQPAIGIGERGPLNSLCERLRFRGRWRGQDDSVAALYFGRLIVSESKECEQQQEKQSGHFFLTSKTITLYVHLTHFLNRGTIFQRSTPGVLPSAPARAEWSHFPHCSCNTLRCPDVCERDLRRDLSPHVSGARQPTFNARLVG